MPRRPTAGDTKTHRRLHEDPQQNMYTHIFYGLLVIQTLIIKTTTKMYNTKTLDFNYEYFRQPLLRFIIYYRNYHFLCRGIVSEYSDDTWTKLRLAIS